MSQTLKGGSVFTAKDIVPNEYLPNKGVFLHGMLGKGRGDAFGFYYARLEPGCAIAREIHPETSETVYVLSGDAIGFVGDQEVPLKPGQCLHVDKNTHHGLRNAGSTTLEVLIVGHPDF